MGQLNTQNNEGIIDKIIDDFINPLGIFAQNT